MKKRLSIALAAAALFAFGANAQDSTGGIVGNANAGDTVELHAPEIGVHREVSVEATGKYKINRLPVGVYVVTIKHADGTADAAKKVAVRVGTTTRLK